MPTLGGNYRCGNAALINSKHRCYLRFILYFCGCERESENAFAPKAKSYPDSDTKGRAADITDTGKRML